jgi:stearoyl-CoA desaturase (delta-9 desaturase)
MKFNTYDKFKVLHITNHLVGLLGIYLALQSGEWYWFLLGFIFFLWTGIVGVDVALHRYYSHKSFKTTPFREKIMLWTSVFTGLGSPAMWCSIHRMHHSHSDTDKDPHNPRLYGVIKTWFTLWPHKIIPKRFYAPFVKTKELKFINNNYFLINFIVLILLALIDIRLAAFLYCLPSVGCFHGAGAIGVIPHYVGYRKYNITDESRNSWIASILSLGEGWHNNHHANPGRWWQGEEWWEVDPPAFMIKHFFMIKE